MTGVRKEAKRPDKEWLSGTSHIRESEQEWFLQDGGVCTETEDREGTSQAVSQANKLKCQGDSFIYPTFLIINKYVLNQQLKNRFILFVPAKKDPRTGRRRSGEMPHA